MSKSRSDAVAPVQVMVETPQPVPAMMIGDRVPLIGVSSLA